MTSENVPIDTDPVPDELQDGETVLEAGCYEGAWTLKVMEKYPSCQVYAFEPATRAYKVAQKKLADYPTVHLRDVALGKKAGTAILCDINRDGANTFDWNPEHEPSESVTVIDVAPVVEPLGEIAVAHLNAEGDELTILERLLEAGLIERFRLILVQWHLYDQGMRARAEVLAESLRLTHTFERRNAWGCWKRKSE